MKNKPHTTQRPETCKIIPITSCKGKKGGCYWEGEPEGITYVPTKIAA